MKRPRTIRSSLMLGYATVILLVTGLLMGITSLGARTRAQEQSSHLMRRAMSQTKESLDGFFGPVARSAALVRKWAASGILKADDPAALRRLVRPILLQIEHLSWVEILDSEQRRIRIARADGRWTLWKAAEGSEIEAWSWADGAGEREDLGPAGAAPLEALAWRRRGSGGELLAPAEGIVWEKALDPASPWGSLAADGWYETESGSRGMIALGVDLDRISELTRALRPTREALAMVLIESGDGGSVPVEVIGLPRLPRFEDAAARLAARGKSARELGIPLIDDALAEVLPRGRDALDEPLPFLSAGDTWWLDTDEYRLGSRVLFVVILIPQVNLLGDRTTLRWWILAGAVLALLASMGLASRLARRSERPIQALVDESERMREGDFEASDPVRSNITEFRELAQAHDEMRVSLASLVKLKQDLEIARQIQQATIPATLPRVPGYEIAGSSVPADRTGGDTYDLIGVRTIEDGPIPRWEPCADDPDLLVCLVADATGHGIGPALSVTQLRAMVRMAIRVMPSDEAFAPHLNEQLCADLPPARFISAWIGRLDPNAHTIRGLSAGHGPIWHYKAADASFESLGSQMPPFGLFPAPKIAPFVVTPLALGDLYIVLTDGFHESLSPAGELFEEERVQDVIREHAEAAPAEIIEAVAAAVEAFTGGAPQDDDRTALIIKRRA